MAADAPAQDPSAEPAAEGAPPAAPVELDRATYDILRKRLADRGRELRDRLAKLDAARKDVFGSIELKVLSTDRATTENNCVPRDIAPVGRFFLFGYNVYMGLKTEVAVSDVFSVYERVEGRFEPRPLALIADERFERDFKELYKYYKETSFAKFGTVGPHFFMKFRTGKRIDDFKTFKWATRGDSLAYGDNRSEHEFRYPPQHEFEWKRTHRDLHRHGKFPHVSIEDRVFVETVGGDLTIKIENNTDTGEGIYSEPVDHRDQTLDDAEIHYARVGHLVLLKIKPYQEQKYRFIVFNEKLRRAKRLDSIERACVLLPNDHGILFPNGYYLQDGETKTFESAPADTVFERRIASPNGEDHLFVFYAREEGIYVLLRYNAIARTVDPPIVCHGYSFFENGEMLCLAGQKEPSRHHTIQIWQTPFVGPNFVPPVVHDSFLFKLGNREIVRALSECHELVKLIEREETYADQYRDIDKLSREIADAYFWIDKPEAFDLKASLLAIGEAAGAAIGEFEKVERARADTRKRTEATTKKSDQLLGKLKGRKFDAIDGYVAALAEMRALRGEIVGLRDLKYRDDAAIDALEKRVAEATDRLAEGCVEFLLAPNALEPYRVRVDAQRVRADAVAKLTEARELEKEIGETSAQLELLVEIVGNLKIDDATKRTAIVDDISAIFTFVNQARAALKARARQIASVEGAAEFNSQSRLLSQSLANYLDVCDTPRKCDEYLTKLMVQVEELEGRFAEFDEYVVQLADKREEIRGAFEARRVALVEARNRRAEALAQAADRILKGIATRVEGMKEIAEIHAYFASDLMVEKLRDLVARLLELEDTVKADDLQSRLKSIREDAVRQLKDRRDLFVDGQNVIRFGKHAFTVNVQPLELTTIRRDGKMCLHLTGTNFFEEIEDARIVGARDFWDQEVVSETPETYRAEYLAYLLLTALGTNGFPTAAEVVAQPPEATLELVRGFMAPRYAEGYAKGVHDHDAAAILRALAGLRESIRLLRYSTRARALAGTFWRIFRREPAGAVAKRRVRGFGEVRRLFKGADRQDEYIAELRQRIAAFARESGLFPETLAGQAAEYTFHEIAKGPGFVIAREARDLYVAFRNRLMHASFASIHQESVARLQDDALAAFRLHRDWLRAFVEDAGAEAGDAAYIDEVALLLLTGHYDDAFVVDRAVSTTAEGLLGTHPRVADKRIALDYPEFVLRLEDHRTRIAPAFERYHEAKRGFLEEAREAMRLEEFRPRVLTSFVRNKLIDKVYLPLIGDNLAKQAGSAGEGKRTDLMGLLLIVSPPGYGKTTLMEYVANRLGLIFMKVNGPAIGHQATSLDPADAPNAGARQEIDKLNLAFEMGDNVMIYLDDIQHCNPELLQKFISLCDAQRKIEGVYKGRTRTYDLRGKKVVVVMAGNPYTESGEKFQIPDMLANRADTYNLGEIVGDSREAFDLSFIENSLTSNPVLNRLAARSQSDVYSIVKLAETGSNEPVDLEGDYSGEEIREMTEVMRRLLRVRDVVLRANQEYIKSAAQADAYRTEPPFKLQGSYRNMNKMAEKVVAVMNDEELETLIRTHYESDAQTLTTGAEANLLKFYEMIGAQTPEQAERWEAIKTTFRRNQALKGLGGDDKTAQALLQLKDIGDALGSIRETIREGAVAAGADRTAPIVEQANRLNHGLAAIREALGKLREAAAASPATLKASFDEGAIGFLNVLAAKVAEPGRTPPVPQTLRATFDETALAAFKTLAGEIAKAATARPIAPPPVGGAAVAAKSAGEPSVVKAVFDDAALAALRDLAKSAAAAASRPAPAAPSSPGRAIPAMPEPAQPPRAPASDIPHTIEVVNKVPETILRVLEHQCELMKEWLEPTFRATEKQREEMRDLRDTVEKVIDHYEGLAKTIATALGKR